MSKQKNIAQLPLENIHDDKGDLESKRLRFLGKEKIQSILRTEKVHFVIADLDKPIQWIPLEECYDFWNKIKQNICKDKDIEGFILEDYPEQYVYVPSEWSNENEKIILLEMHH